MTRVVCKEKGKQLGKCLIKFLPGKTTHGITCLQTRKKLLDVQGKEESEAIKWKTMGNDKDQGGGKKLKATHLNSFFPSNVIHHKKK